MKLARILTALLIAATLTGCMEVNSVIDLKKDGSGTITEAVFFNDAMLQMMGGMAGGMGGGQAAQEEFSIPINEEEYKAKAAQMGTGVRFVEAKEIKTGGKVGLKIKYEFDDINTIRMDQQPTMPGQGMGGMQQQPKEPKSVMTFNFKKGPESQLTISMPRQDDKETEKQLEQMEDVEMPEIPPEQMEMMKQMFDGFRIRIMIRLDGVIKKTNASYVSKSRSSKGNNVITIMDMDIGKIIGDEEQFKKLTSMGEIKDVEQAKKMLKDFPGLKIETEETVKVSF